MASTSEEFPSTPAAQLRGAVNRIEDPQQLKGMLLYIADNLERGEQGVHCIYCPLALMRPGPPCAFV